MTLNFLSIFHNMLNDGTESHTTKHVAHKLIQSMSAPAGYVVDRIIESPYPFIKLNGIAHPPTLKPGAIATFYPNKIGVVTAVNIELIQRARGEYRVAWGGYNNSLRYDPQWNGRRLKHWMSDDEYKALAVNAFEFLVEQVANNTTLHCDSLYGEHTNTALEYTAKFVIAQDK